jgi:hypothetical protein
LIILSGEGVQSLLPLSEQGVLALQKRCDAIKNWSFLDSYGPCADAKVTKSLLLFDLFLCFLAISLFTFQALAPLSPAVP